MKEESITELIVLFLFAIFRFPMWTAVMKQHFKYGNVTVSSSNVESYFNDLKNRLLRNLPYRVDDFVLKHNKVLEGETYLSILLFCLIY